MDVRVISATNRNLEQEVAAGRFRADLYHRLATYPIAIPPLRHRQEDLPILADLLLNQHRRRIGCPPAVLGGSSLELLKTYAWPGNVRELDNVLARAVVRALGDAHDSRKLEIAERHLAPDLEPNAQGQQPELKTVSRLQDERSLVEQVEDFQRGLISDRVRAHNGNWAAAAKSLGMHRANMHVMAKRLGLK